MNNLKGVGKGDSVEGGGREGREKERGKRISPPPKFNVVVIYLTDKIVYGLNSLRCKSAKK